MDEIQRHIIKRGKRNVISQHYRAKDDKEAITAWRSDLDGILRVFDVCFVTPARRSLTFRFQTELGVEAHATTSDTHQNTTNKPTIVSDIHRDSSNAGAIVPDIHRGVSNTSPVVSDVRSDVAETPTVVSDIHSNKSKGREGADGRNQAVSAIRTLPVTE